MKLLAFVLVAFPLGTVVEAQGSDSCATPQVISGLGPFAFTTGTTGTEGQSDATCSAASVNGIQLDVWFTWTASTSGNYAVKTCGLTGLDTEIAVYEGAGCPTSLALACNDDSCGVQSSATFTPVAGHVYTFQIGVYPTTGGGSGQFVIEAQVPCSAVTGPDVIVGDVTGPSNYPASGGMDAISLGTTSCNLGSVWLNWMANVNQHPVIGGNLYRYRVVAGSGRFEQIGQSWLKHGFYALSETLCCPTCIATDGSHLGIGCSDPYTSGRNGGQAALGPRSDVNAHLGAYPYPPSNPAWSGPTARRLAFLTADIDTSSSARYFGEAQYVTPDDALAGNQDNNASYRELAVTGSISNWNFAFAAGALTHRAQSAVEAWAVCESGVSVTDVHVPGEGLFKLGSKVTDLGGGMWHYEYALYNMNSDRSGGALMIPVSGGASLTSTGFHCVPYRDGDGIGGVSYSATDWVVTQNANGITWATETQAANANANALRWGTTYNFRFDANVAPAPGLAVLGLWRPGTPANVGIPVAVPGGVAALPFCFGDGSGSACPCGNSGVLGRGCGNSVDPNGARLVARGNPSISSDTFVLQADGMPNGTVLYSQGASFSGTEMGTPFGDGLRCLSGALVRLGIKHNAGGVSRYPEAGDASISVLGTVVPGQMRYYQACYRNIANFCTSAGFNQTNGMQAVWAP